MNNDAPPPYDDQPKVVIAGATGFAPQPPQQQQFYPQQHQQFYPQQQQPTIIIQQSRPNRWFFGNTVGDQASQPPKSIYKSPLKWAIFNAIVFFPLFFFWIPALYYSKQTRSAYLSANYMRCRQLSRKAHMFNSICLIGIIGWIVFIILMATVYNSANNDFDGCYLQPNKRFYECNSRRDGCRYGYRYSYLYSRHRYYYRCSN